MGLILTDTNSKSQRTPQTNQAVEVLGCFSCGKTNVHMTQYRDSLNPNAYLCDGCKMKYIDMRGIDMAPEAERLLTLPVKRTGSCCHCAKELYTVGSQGMPPVLCGDCQIELRKMRHQLRAKKEGESA